MMRKRCSQLTIRLRFDCDTIRQRYDHRATSMRFPFDVHSLAFTYLSLSSGRGKLYTILYYTIYHTVSQKGDYKIWATMQQHVYQTKIRNVDELRQRLLNVWSSIEQDVSSAHPLTSGVCDSKHACVREATF